MTHGMTHSTAHSTTHLMQFTTKRLAGALCLLACWCVCATASADSVTLKNAVRVEHGSTVTLDQVATLDGTALEKFASLEVATADSGAFELSVDALRQKLANAGADLKTIRFQGSSTVVRPSRGRAAQVREGTTQSIHANAPAVAPIAIAAVTAAKTETLTDPREFATQLTPLGIVCNLVSNAFCDETDSMRLFIRDADLAKLTAKPGLRYEIIPRSALKTDRVDVEVVAYEGVKSVSRERVRIEPRLRRDACIAECDLKRGTTLDAISFTTDERFLAPSIANRAATRDEVLSSSLARTIPAGSILESDDLAREVSIHRNDRVMVRREVGMVAIEIEAIALEDGSAGDIIALQRAGTSRRRDTEALTAEVVGQGRAVIR